MDSDLDTASSDSEASDPVFMLPSMPSITVGNNRRLLMMMPSLERINALQNLHQEFDDSAQVVTAGDQHQAFDVALPVKHSYLGADLQELKGRTLYDDNSVVTLPLLVQRHGIVALPGQTLPLHLFHSATITLLREAIAKDRTFGLVSGTERYNMAPQQELAKHPLVGCVGVTAEVYEHQDTVDDRTGYGLKARCRQRFKVMEVTENSNATTVGRVFILPEMTLPRFLPECRAKAPARLGSRRQQRNFHASLTKWPAWVYDLYDENVLVERIKRELEVMRLTGPQDAPGVASGSPVMLKVPSEPAALSFWVAQNLPLMDSQRSALLEINSSLQRLRWELSFMESCQGVCCQVCGELLAATGDTFSMSVEGPQGTYVNPSGYLHETMTVTRVQNVRTIGQPSSDSSWFPGYLWTIAQCRQCDSHIGWRFTAKSLLPPIFWGLSRRSIVTLIKGSNASEEFRPVM